MRRLLSLGLFFIIIAAPTARAQDDDAKVIDGRAFVSRTHGVRFSVPQGFDALRIGSAATWSWAGELCEVNDKQGALELFLASEETGKKLEDFVETFDELMRTSDGTTEFRNSSEKKLAGREGEWVRREYRWVHDQEPLRFVAIYTVRGKRDVKLCLWVSESRWDEKKPIVDAIVDSFGALDDPEVKDGRTFVSRGHAITFAIPEGWGTLSIGADAKWGWPGELCEGTDKKDEVGLCLTTVEATGKLDDALAAFEKNRAATDGTTAFKRQSEKKLEGRAGEWIRRDYSWVHDNEPLVFVVVATVKNGVLYTLSIWIAASSWDAQKDTIGAIAESLDATKDVKPAAPSPAPKKEKP